MATDETPRKPLTAADLMTASPRTCSPFSSVLEAVLIFRDADCGVVPVVDTGQAVGVLTDRDVALALADYPDLSRRPVSDVMTKEVATVPADATLETVKERFGSKGVRRLLVVAPDGLLLGIIALADLAPHLRDEEIGGLVTDVTQHP